VSFGEITDPILNRYEIVKFLHTNLMRKMGICFISRIRLW
jgi:hypothetical protein